MPTPDLSPTERLLLSRLRKVARCPRAEQHGDEAARALSALIDVLAAHGRRRPHIKPDGRFPPSSEERAIINAIAATQNECDNLAERLAEWLAPRQWRAEVKAMIVNAAETLACAGQFSPAPTPRLLSPLAATPKQLSVV